MTEKLDSFRPPREVVAAIRTQLVNAGVDTSGLPGEFEWLEAFAAATFKWIKETEAGLQLVSRLLSFEVERGRDEKEYELIEDELGLITKISPADIYFFRGCLVKNISVPPRDVQVSERFREQCDECGVTAHCLKKVLDPFTDTLKELCNYCLTYHEHQKISDQGGRSICEGCTATSCVHHPEPVSTYDHEGWRESL